MAGERMVARKVGKEKGWQEERMGGRKDGKEKGW